MSFSGEDRSNMVLGYPTMPSNYPQSLPVYPFPGQVYGPALSHPHPGYPNTANPKAFPPSPPSAAYYSQHYHPMEAHRETGATFVRFTLLMMFLLVVGLGAMSLVMWLLYGSEVPEFRVASLVVPNFKITNSTLEANWDANVTVINPNQNLKIYFDHIESYILYQNNFLAMASPEPFHLRRYVDSTLLTQLTTNTSNSEQTTPELRQWVVNQMAVDRSNGTITFSLRIALGAKFRAGSLWRQQTMKVFCENLKVRFSNATDGAGTLAGGLQDDCLIFS